VWPAALHSGSVWPAALHSGSEASSLAQWVCDASSLAQWVCVASSLAQWVCVASSLAQWVCAASSLAQSKLRRNPNAALLHLTISVTIAVWFLVDILSVIRSADNCTRCSTIDAKYLLNYMYDVNLQREGGFSPGNDDIVPAQIV